jgi:hypothetical protein
MNAEAQIKYICELILSGAKVLHHGTDAHYCYVGGKQFPAKHLHVAQGVLETMRKMKKAELASQGTVPAEEPKE